jgi:glycosyltransferase involved in cell wall biosynthesis
MSNPIKISAVVITYNEEKNIGRCIDSLKPVADEIIVVDCFSKDNTKRICFEKGVNFYEHEFLGFAHQKNYAAKLAKDEYLSLELTQSILEVKNNCEHEGFVMNRLSSYEGEWIKTCGWYPDSKLRFWKNYTGYWKGEGIHEWVELKKNSTTYHLNGDLLHHAYDSITQFLEKIQRYSDIYAMEHRYKAHSSAFKVLYKTTYAFIKSFLIKRGIADGYKGLLISVCNANFVFYKYSKLLEANRKLKTSLIISTYNREDALELTLLSVLNQSVMPDQIIVADDGSRSTTKELIDFYKNKFAVPLLHCWHEDTGFHPGQIKNKAVAMAQNDYIISIHGDIVLPKNFIKAHKKNALKGRFVQGQRVSLSEQNTQWALTEKETDFALVRSEFVSKMSAAFSGFVSKVISGINYQPEGTKSCNMAFWKEDFLNINGFNEDIAGMGMEDMEMPVRLMNLGVKRFDLKFTGFGYHLYHPESPMFLESTILHRTRQQVLIRCENGIDKYLGKSKKQVAA